jgi:hypothetical protein
MGVVLYKGSTVVYNIKYRTDNILAKGKMIKVQTMYMLYKTLRRYIKIEQHYSHRNTCALEG